MFATDTNPAHNDDYLDEDVPDGYGVDDVLSGPVTFTFAQHAITAGRHVSDAEVSGSTVDARLAIIAAQSAHRAAHTRAQRGFAARLIVRAENVLSAAAMVR